LRGPSPILTDVTQTSRRREMANKRMDFNSFVAKLLAKEDADVLEWAVMDRRYFTFESIARINEPEGGAPRGLLAAIA
jgi:hypothetical protein